jgi:hypothetical protein
MAKCIFGLEPLNVVDTIFMLDTPENNSNVIGCVLFDKFDPISMKKFFIQNSSEMPKLRKKLVKRFGEDWFTELTPE